ncbi:hypothetical protein [Alteribacter natronophilus]|uniref:hypothetical protein n=1 Tax=Alteribacter natronophilus TaxID=2583810 RepID=UPI00110E7BA4|nr:hypothetical protein [Alteribacter natronophilus]TMW71138.1 hypothetical protein FGB90_14335 [Alteribacter natronophilus]
MNNLRLFAAVVFAGCLVLGIGLSFLTGGGTQVATSQANENGTIGTLEPLRDQGDSEWMLDVTSQLRFGARLQMNDSAFEGAVTMVTDIYEEGEHVAFYSSAVSIYDKAFPLENAVNLLSLLPAERPEEERERWTQVVGSANDYGTSWLDTETDFRSEGYSWSNLEERVRVLDGVPQPFGAISTTGRSVWLDPEADFAEESQSGTIIVFSAYASTSEDEGNLSYWDEREE